LVGGGYVEAGLCDLAGERVGSVPFHYVLLGFGWESRATGVAGGGPVDNPIVPVVVPTSNTVLPRVLSPAVQNSAAKAAIRPSVVAAGAVWTNLEKQAVTQEG
jgi:hypothetical protein